MPKPDGSLDDEHLRAIGRVVANFASFEDGVLTMAIRTLLRGRGLLDMGQTATVISGQLSFRLRLDLIEALFRLVYPSGSTDRVGALRGRGFQVEADRNRIIHSMWGHSDQDEEGAHHLIKSTKGGLKFTATTTSEINDLADRIGALSTDYLRFLTELPQPPESG